MRRPRLTNEDLEVLRRCASLAIGDVEIKPNFCQLIEARVKIDRIIAWNEHKKIYIEERNEQARRKFGRA